MANWEPVNTTWLPAETGAKASATGTTTRIPRAFKSQPGNLRRFIRHPAGSRKMRRRTGAAFLDSLDHCLFLIGEY
jgi:hypothetical protein